MIRRWIIWNQSGFQAVQSTARTTTDCVIADDKIGNSSIELVLFFLRLHDFIWLVSSLFEYYFILPNEIIAISPNERFFYCKKKWSVRSRVKLSVQWTIRIDMWIRNVRVCKCTLNCRINNLSSSKIALGRNAWLLSNDFISLWLDLKSKNY